MYSVREATLGLRQSEILKKIGFAENKKKM